VFSIARAHLRSLLPNLHDLNSCSFIPSKSMDIVAESVYEPPLADSESFALPYDDSVVAVGSFPPDQSFASRISKTKVYLYSENDAASRFGKVRLQLRRNFR